VGRPERDITGAVTPLTEFARGLRALRQGAGLPSYRRLSASTHYSPATLARAAGGQVLPSLEVTLAYVTACDGDAAQWSARWARAAAWLREQADASADSPADSPVAAPALVTAPAGSAGPAGPAGGPAQLPPDTLDFTGRQEQVSLLCGLLGAEPARDRPGVVAISAVAGMGGIGKTSLAVHVAHRLTSRFPDGQLYADLLGATRPARPADVLGRFLRDLGDADEEIPADEPGRAARFRTLLASRRMLIVLDDAASLAQVRLLLPGSATCGVIITSRRTMAGLPGTALLDLEALGESEARALFGAIAGPRRAAAEPEATARVLACCAGLPLAVRIAAGRLASRPGWSVAHLAAKLTDERTRLAELTAGDLAVRASFAVSYDALPPAAGGGVGPAQVFRLLGLTEMTTISLNAVAALADAPPAEVAAALETLADAHLLQAPAPDRYRLHDLLRSFAAELARTEDGQARRDQALGRLLDWYAGQVAAAALAVEPRLPASPMFEAAGPAMAGSAQAIDWFEAELASLATVVAQADVRGRPDIVAAIAAAMWAFFIRAPHWDEWLSMTRAGVAAARQLGDDMVLCWLLTSLGQAYAGLGQFDAAEASMTEALGLRRQIGDRTGVGTALSSLGQLLTYQGRLTEALNHMQTALVIHTAVSDRRLIGSGHHNVGDLLMRLNRHDEALDHMTQALTIWRKVGDRYGEGLTETALAEICFGLDRFEESAGHYRRAESAMADTARDTIEHADALYGLGSALAALGRGGPAREAWQAALPILDQFTGPRAASLRVRVADALARQHPGACLP
jgi:tetratricopeptide (TPR) repeat protein